MPTVAAPIYPQVINTPVQQILPADVSNLKTLYTGGTNGSRLEHLSCISTDTAARDLAFYFTVSSVDYLLATLNVPINSGNTNAIYPVDIFTHPAFSWLPIDANGNRYMYIASGVVLKVKSTTTVTTAKAIQFNIFGGDY
jgi:hypothetical protein